MVWRKGEGGWDETREGGKKEKGEGGKEEEMSIFSVLGLASLGLSIL